MLSTSKKEDTSAKEEQSTEVLEQKQAELPDDTTSQSRTDQEEFKIGANSVSAANMESVEQGSRLPVSGNR